MGLWLNDSDDKDHYFHCNEKILLSTNMSMMNACPGLAQTIAHIPPPLCPSNRHGPHAVIVIIYQRMNDSQSRASLTWPTGMILTENQLGLAPNGALLNNKHYSCQRLTAPCWTAWTMCVMAPPCDT